jgi:hypothetical protein
MTRAKWNSSKNPGDIQTVSFDDVEEPVYPMIGDMYKLYDETHYQSVTAIVARVHFPTKTIYLEPDWSTLIDTRE